MEDITELPLPDGIEGRMETGPVRFGKDDWAGMFLRGDSAFALGVYINEAIGVLKYHDADGEAILIKTLESYANMLQECVETGFMTINLKKESDDETV